MSKGNPRLTDLLRLSQGGDPAARKELVSVLIQEINRLSHRNLMKHRRRASFRTSDLAQEVLLHLPLDALLKQARERAYLFGAVSQAVRQCVVDHARKQDAAKRGGQVTQYPLDEALDAYEPDGLDVLAIYEEIEQLSRLDGRQAEAVRLRYYFAKTNQQIAKLLEISEKTVEADLRLARAWLRRRLSD